jgi:hypothetical protein
LFSGTAVVTYANSKRAPNLRQFGKNILRDPFVAEFSHGLGHECEFDRRRTNFSFGCGILPFGLVSQNEQVAPEANIAAALPVAAWPSNPLIWATAEPHRMILRFPARAAPESQNRWITDAGRYPGRRGMGTHRS